VRILPLSLALRLFTTKPSYNYQSSFPFPPFFSLFLLLSLSPLLCFPLFSFSPSPSLCFIPRLFLPPTRLSLRREPEPVVVRQRKNVKSLGHTAKSQLRTSKSHEDLLTPFSSNSGDSLTTVVSHSDPKVWTPQASHRELVTRHSSPQIERRGTLAGYLGPSYPSLSESEIQVTVEGSPSTSRSKKTSTLPTSRGSSFSSSGSGGSRPVSRASSEKRRKSLSDNDSSEARKLPEFLPLHPEPLFRKPHLSPTLRLKKQRGHLKSQSLGNK